MQLKIQNAAVELSGNTILQKVNIEINDASKIAIVGRNGCGKTTLLRLISGEIAPAHDRGADSFIAVSGKPVIGVLSQMTFRDNTVAMVEEIRSTYKELLSMKAELDTLQIQMESDHSEEVIHRYTSLLEQFTNAGGFYFEKEYLAAIKNFGFSEEEKLKPLSDFSGGQRTKIAFIKLLLSKPDILLLDEPTNHLDIDAVTWLEGYIRDYKKAVVIVSHDRMFLDRTVDTVYEIEHGKTTRYTGGYTAFTEQKKALREQQAKDYEAQQKEIARLNELVIKFKYKPTKAAMAQSKLKQIERIVPIEAPEAYDNRTFHTNFQPEIQSVKEVLTVAGLQVGFDRPLAEVDLTVLRGQRIGIIGGNGLGKSTFLKTLVGNLAPLSGTYRFGGAVGIGYFDQQMAHYSGTNTVLDDFLNAFPGMGNFEARSALGAFLFSGEDVFKTVDMLSGGERVRLALCKLFRRKPNFLILDEPTNHMDLVGKETLEAMLSDYTGTLLFVSHDRYFVRKLAQRLLVFGEDGVKLYEYGYEQYLEEQQGKTAEQAVLKEAEPQAVKPKKSYTTPGKEKAKLERALSKAEEQIALLEERLDGIKQELSWEENASDYLRLSELQTQLDATEEQLLEVLARWESLSAPIEE